MDKLIITGGNPLKGEIKVTGAKNVAMKVLLAGLLTDDTITVSNVPHISSTTVIADMLKSLGVDTTLTDHTMKIQPRGKGSYEIPLELGGLNRAATMVIGPLLARYGKAAVPNPGGCRIGKRPIDRHIEGLKAMGAKIEYKDGFFVAEAAKLHGANYTFQSNSHTGTETLILAAVLAQGQTVLENASAEPEVDDLIRLLNAMGANIQRAAPRTIKIEGVAKLHGTQFEIMPDRNEVVTFAIGAIATGGDVVVEGTQREHLKAFLTALDHARANWEPISATKTRFWASPGLKAADIETAPHPGFMTDWQSPWALLMTQADGISTIHETIYEDRFGFVGELEKMGATIEYFHPAIKNPENVYNFNWTDRKENTHQAIRIHGPKKLHNALLEVCDLRAGATVVLAALIASGHSVIQGIDHIDRGYEDIEGRLTKLGATIRRERDDT